MGHTTCYQGFPFSEIKIMCYTHTMPHIPEEKYSIKACSSHCIWINKNRKQFTHTHTLPKGSGVWPGQSWVQLSMVHSLLPRSTLITAIRLEPAFQKSPLSALPGKEHQQGEDRARRWGHPYTFLLPFPRLSHTTEGEVCLINSF